MWYALGDAVAGYFRQTATFALILSSFLPLKGEETQLRSGEKGFNTASGWEPDIVSKMDKNE